MDQLRDLAAFGKLGLVVRQAAQRPFGQLRDVVVCEATLLVHAEVAALRHGDQGFKHVRCAFGTREQAVVAQGLRRLSQVALAAVLQIQADQVDNALAGPFQLGPQELAAEVTCNLHHAFGGFGLYRLELSLIDEAVPQAVSQGLFKKRPRVEQRNGLSGFGMRRYGIRHSALKLPGLTLNSRLFVSFQRGWRGLAAIRFTGVELAIIFLSLRLLALT